MDIAKFGDPRAAASQGAWCVITDPETGEETDFRIQVRGSDSPEFDRFIANIEQAQKPNRTMTVAQQRRHALDLLTAMTISWDGLEDDGKPVPFTTERARELFAQQPWLREQVDTFIANRRNFMKSSAPSS